MEARTREASKGTIIFSRIDSLLAKPNVVRSFSHQVAKPAPQREHDAPRTAPMYGRRPFNKSFFRRMEARRYYVSQPGFASVGEWPALAVRRNPRTSAPLRTTGSNGSNWDRR